MQNKYLLTEKLPKEIKNKGDKISKKFISYSKNLINPDMIICTLEIPNKDNLNCANKLDKFHSEILNVEKDAIVIACESSQYYNRKLYPIINKMERNLRALIYIKKSDINNEKDKRLEEMTFNDLYESLFIDEKFTKKIKELFKVMEKDKSNEKFLKGKFTKEELDNEIGKIEEKNKWDFIIGKDNVKSLRDNFEIAKEYRNWIMHAHNISKEQYEEILKLYKTINEELEIEIEMIRTKPAEINSMNDLELKNRAKNDFNSYIHDDFGDIYKLLLILISTDEKAKEWERLNRHDEHNTKESSHTLNAILDFCAFSDIYKKEIIELAKKLVNEIIEFIDQNKNKGYEELDGREILRIMFMDQNGFSKAKLPAELPVPL